MIKYLDTLDKKLLIIINSIHSPFLDTMMIFFSEKWVWVPFYILLIILLTIRFKKRIWLVLINIGILITISDQFASALIKPLVERLRPCHDPTINHLLYLVKGCGGTYGFISSHAANTFALAAFFAFVFRKSALTFFLFFWSFMVSLSRVYLGAHYPGDVIFGAFSGIFFGYIISMSFRRTENFIYHNNTINHT